MTVDRVEQASAAELAEMARNACGSLEPILGALQSDSAWTDALRDLATPLADALIALVRIEASALEPPEATPVDACPFELRPRARRESAPLHMVDLGLQSASNFYRGLSGDDVVDGGGVFVATYDLPEADAPVRLRVRMVGYEFEANAVVRWRRGPGEALDDAPPGFGARITAITPQARALVNRYVRNREPIFHDDA